MFCKIFCKKHFSGAYPFSERFIPMVPPVYINKILLFIVISQKVSTQYYTKTQGILSIDDAIDYGIKMWYNALKVILNEANMKVICWDFDGTLVYSEHLWSGSVFRALNESVSVHNVLFTDIRRCMATGFTWHTPYEDYSQMTGEKWWDFMNARIYRSYISLGIEPELAKAATDKVRGIIKEEKNYNLYADTIAVLGKSRELGYKNVLLSNNYPDLTEVLDKLDLTHRFDDLIISALVGYDKPRDEIFNMAKEPYPDGEFIMVGDNPLADIEGGKRAGMKTVLVHKSECAAADYCFDDLMSVLEV